MKPIRSFHMVCIDYGLDTLQIHTLQSLIRRRKGVLHPYWIQLALYMPYDFAKRLRDELIANEWVITDEEEVDGIIYETELNTSEIMKLAELEIRLST